MNPKHTNILSLISITILAFIDYNTYHLVSLRMGYMIPLGLLAWQYGKNQAIAISMLVVGYTFWLDTLFPLYTWHFNMYFFALESFLFYYAAIWGLDKAKLQWELKKEAADKDTLTGLYTRRLFHELADQELAKCNRYSRTFCIAYLDVDNFKQVNDTLGHKEGDKVLKELSQGLKTILRKSDIVARLGGDEFIILFPETNKDQVKIVLQKIVENTHILATQNNWPITLSLGSIEVTKPAPTLQDIVEKADSLMYAVKHNGKNSMLIM